ncbi:hypothetical protein [Bradyrhizobium sp. USDA 3315]
MVVRIASLGAFACTTADAAAGRGAHQIAVEPLGEGAGLGPIAWQAAIELRNPGALVKKDLPVLGRPAIFAKDAATPRC